MPHKGSYTQGMMVLFDAPLSIEDLSNHLEGYGLAKIIDECEEWAFGGPTVVIPYRPEVNGYVAVDIVDREWPDAMGSPEDDSVLFGAWAMGHFGPFAFPGNLQRAAQQSWHWEAGKTLPFTHKAFVRIRSSYAFGASDDTPLMPKDYEPQDELLFVTSVARGLLGLPGAICYFDPNGETVYSAAGIDELMSRHANQDLMPQELWVNVRLFNLEDHDPWVVMDTVGMWQLDVPDHEAVFPADRYDPSEVAGFLRNTADYVFKNGLIINDNDTMDGPGPMRWQAVTFDDPICSPPREVLRWIPRDGSTPPHQITQGKSEDGDSA
ncbi:MAG: DUF4261 domain-containing protein [bacterium]|nr:DUF4261 domain-containing protein [bacterium]